MVRPCQRMDRVSSVVALAVAIRALRVGTGKEDKLDLDLAGATTRRALPLLHVVGKRETVHFFFLASGVAAKSLRTLSKRLV